MVFEGTQDSLVADHQSLIGLFGMVVAADSAANTIRDSTIAEDDVDCLDDTSGDGTAGTANTWSNVMGETANRPGICTPANLVAP